MAEQLRLDATVVDRFSKPLGELRAKMQMVTRTGQTGTKATSAEFQRFHNSVARVTQSLRGGLEPSLAAVGLAGLGAGLAMGGVAGAIAGVVASIRKFSTSTIEMKNLSRETGVAIVTIQKLESVSAQFGAKSENIAAGLAKFRSNIFDAKIGQGIIGELGIRKGGEELIKAMQEASPEEALNKALEFLAKQKDNPERQKRLSNLIFGTDDFQKLVQEGIPALRKAMDAAKVQPLISDEDLKRAREYEGAIAKLAAQWNILVHKIGEITVPWITDLVDNLDKAIDKGKTFYQTMIDGSVSLGEKLKALPKSIDEGTEIPNVGGATRKAIDWLKELFGVKEAGAAETKPEGEKKKPGGLELPGVESFRNRDDIREGTKQGFIEAMRQMMRERVAGDTATGGGRVWNASYGGGAGGVGGGTGGGGGGGYGEGQHSGGGDGGKGTPDKPRGHYSGVAGPHRGQKSILHGGAMGGVPLGSTAGNLTKLIDEESRKAGLDPRIMEGIRAGESLHTDKYDVKDDRLESSWGPFQLNRRSGTGVEFEKETGLDLRDPKTIPAQVKWVAEYLRKKYAKNPNYSPFPNWQGFHGLRNANPKWGDSGYVPDKPTKAAVGGASGEATAQAAESVRLPPNIPKPGTGYRAIPGYENFGVEGPEHRPGAGLRAQASASPFGLSGPVAGARTGKATMEISLKGFPAANTKADGGSLFDKIEVRRGHGMQEAR